MKKFRAWVEYGGIKEMTYDNIIIGSKGLFIEKFGADKKFSYRPVTHASGIYNIREDYEHLMLSTGLKGKNGVEIYKGDILLIPGSYCDVVTDAGEGITEEDNAICVVVFNRGCFGVYVKAELFPTALWVGYHSFIDIEREIVSLEEIEVLGNKYENPELLEN